jgi:hypothetical protein
MQDLFTAKFAIKYLNCNWIFSIILYQSIDLPLMMTFNQTIG